MTKSMTSFGRGQSAAREGSWLVEIRTVNSRYLDIHLKTPPSLGGVEESIKKAVSQRFSRGRVNIFIRALGAAEPSPALVLNKPLVREYKRVLDELKEELGVAEDPGLAPFLSNRDLVLMESPPADDKALWQELEPAVSQALDGAESMRRTEGDILAEDLSARLEVIDGLFAKVAARAPEIVKAYQSRLNDRVAQLMNGADPDPQRIALEVALIADKCDITEEAVRADSHLAQFRDFLTKDEPVGRKLDFLIQELNREANTMGSKSPDANSSSMVVEIKAELERIREQVQNIE